MINNCPQIIAFVWQLHTNPTFYKATGKEKFVSLKKDETKGLINGNVISLLPDSLCFEVICEESLANNGVEKEQAETPKSKATDYVLPVTDETVVHDQEKPLASSKVPTGKRGREKWCLLNINFILQWIPEQQNLWCMFTLNQGLSPQQQREPEIELDWQVVRETKQSA